MARIDNEGIEIVVKDCGYGFAARALFDGAEMYGFTTTHLYATANEAAAEVAAMLDRRSEARA